MAEAKGAINAYVCEKCKQPTVTVNAAAGTTPFMIRCKRPGCGGVARSSFYRVPPGSVPTHEWYHPSRLELAKLDDPTREYCERGAMLLRRIVQVVNGREQPRKHAGRNWPCPCGSGRKWKRCCGSKLARVEGG